ncbi:hypothetical protein FE257_004896 [Aspergillus nanangensis]|uniref:Zn(2)-C6 fungal-type domain-containing protein n=1 Tax=Aspergillus nanangensis TaxID=2582783 RepID=A0AAD4CAK9_ASPNN|nr:hypothetical protein FE257_004896 [Aspergillus nanangensis]
MAEPGNFQAAGNRDKARQAAGTAKIRRRARLVCLRCNEKKIKCDLDSQPRADSSCLNCVQAGSECRPRPSNRNAHRRRRPNTLPLSDSHTVSVSNAVEPSLNASFGVPCFNTTQAPDPVIAAVDVTNVLQPHHAGSLSSPGSQQSGSHHTPPQPALPLANQARDVEFGGGVPDMLMDGLADQTVSHPANCAEASYLGESGYMPVFSHVRGSSKTPVTQPFHVDIRYSISPLPPTLYESYADAYFRNCYCFCPVLDKDMLQAPQYGGSILLQQSLALVGSVVRASLVYHDDPSSHYDRARLLLHLGAETHPLTVLISVMLFYWWNTSPPNVVSMNGPWWWTGVAIRQAQELGLHCELKASQPPRAGESVGLRRRIFWTLFGRPYTINPRDCDVHPPSTSDFPDPSNPQALIFVQWVSLCSIVGRVGDHLRLPKQTTHTTERLLDELTTWVHALPPSLQLPFSDFPTARFDRPVFQLHLPYLSCITLLYLEKTKGRIPIAHSAAILAASYTARIFEDFLARGSLSFLQGMAGWHISMALLALLHARQVKALEDAIQVPFHVLRVALKEMAKRWPSAKMYDNGVDKLLATQQQLPLPAPGPVDVSSSEGGSGQRMGSSTMRAGGGGGAPLPDIIPTPPMLRVVHRSESEQPPPLTGEGKSEELVRFFPGATKNSSPIFELLLSSDREPTLVPESDVDPSDDSGLLFFGLFDDLANFDPSMPYDHPADLRNIWETNLAEGGFGL